MYIYIYIFTYVYTYTYIYIYIYIHTYIHYITLHYITLQYNTIQYNTIQYIHTYIYIYMYTYIYAYIHIVLKYSSYLYSSWRFMQYALNFKWYSRITPCLNKHTKHVRWYYRTYKLGSFMGKPSKTFSGLAIAMIDFHRVICCLMILQR